MVDRLLLVPLVEEITGKPLEDLRELRPFSSVSCGDTEAYEVAERLGEYMEYLETEFFCADREGSCVLLLLLLLLLVGLSGEDRDKLGERLW